MDAPTADAEFGPDATAHLQRLTRSGNVRCEPTGERSHDRLVERCYDASNRDLAAVMVQDGWSIDWPDFSAGHYSSNQELALEAGRGLHNRRVESWY